jgi:hypothetical protein
MRCSGSPVARARMKTTTDKIARATSDWKSRARTKRITGAASPDPYFDAASWSMKRSYITVPTVHLGSVFEVA